ncbi:MAG: glycosyltransferase family A protein [Candidatus Peribacteraceae bacterium]|nr:glycosyltransferase family A protein [Candidatus Peribacteraceae bacterium]MDD5740052.1 glycosyltransferase family A protein [Candidatus Peribacteraceae bacterium]
MKSISAIIPAHNEEKYIADCLASLLAHRTSNLCEIIVVDNASTDATVKIAAGFEAVKVVSEPKKGLTHARQRGLTEARGELLAYIDADTRIHASWFHTINRHFSANPSHAALSGPYDYYDLPRWQRLLVNMYWHLAAPASLMTGYMIVGGNFVARKDALLAIGGFDTTISFFGEDTNIARRLKKNGPVRFKRQFFIYSSGRRLAGEGILKTAGTYVLNFLSEVLLHRPLTQKYTDIR